MSPIIVTGLLDFGEISGPTMLDAAHGLFSVISDPSGFPFSFALEAGGDSSQFEVFPDGSVLADPTSSGSKTGIVDLFPVSPPHVLLGQVFLTFRAEFPSPPPPTTGAPEPAAWGLMILGFALVCGLLRVRRRAPAAA